MTQINIHTTEEFERDLLTVMSAMKVFGKSKAIRFAVREVAEACRDSERRQVTEVSGGNGASR